MSMQIWKDIEGYKGHYQISNYGNVRSLKKDAFLMKGGYLKGYKIISLWKNGTGKMFRVHRLVAAAFIPNPENKPCIDHIDGNRANNHADNLRWVTAKENSNNYNAPNTYKGKKINKGGKAVLQYDLEGNFIKEWVTTMEIQRQLNYHRSNISNCCNGLVKTAYNYIWRYKNE